MDVSETQSVAEIETRLANMTDVRERIDALVHLGWRYLNVDTRKALQFSEQALELSTSGDYALKPYEQGRLFSLRNISKCFSITGDYVRAMPIAMELIGAAVKEPGNPAIHAHALTILGYCYFRLGDYPRALEMHFEALKIGEEHELEEIPPRSLDSIAFIHGALGELTEAIAYHKRALGLCRDDVSWQAFGHNNLAVAYIQSGDYDSALQHASKSLELGRTHNIVRVLPHVLDTIGMIYQEMGDIPKAIGFFEEAVEFARKTDVRVAEVDALRNLGVACQMEGKSDEAALEHLRLGLLLAERLNAKRQQINCHQTLSDVLARLGDFETALEHHRHYARLEREVFSEQADRKLKTLQVVHETESAKKEAEIHRLKNIELQKALDSVKLLSGLLPICASCKNVRDDSGYWNQIEDFIHDHSEAEFSHSLCPTCARKLYPNLAVGRKSPTG
ncbi:MAG: tetratricopeptide repeat protein [candidate division Zixibacteria bacterium]|nr:tetratricopeptide repeat protein [candidate division Zixibacteria bacterium]